MCDSFSPNEWVLLVRKNGALKPLHREMLFVGRSECDIILESPSIDNRHAVICFNPVERLFFVKDLNTSHGTFLNDSRVACQSYVRLNHLDKIRFGFSSDVFVVCRSSQLSDASPPTAPPNSSMACDRSQRETTAVACDLRDGETELAHELISCEQQLGAQDADDIPVPGDVGKTTKKLHPISPSLSATCVLEQKANRIEDSNACRTGSPIATQVPSLSSNTDSAQESSARSPSSMAMAFTISFGEESNVKKKVFRSSFRKSASKSENEEKSRVKKPSDHKAVVVRKVTKPKRNDPLPQRLADESAAGQLSDSATYLIQRMLASEPADMTTSNSSGHDEESNTECSNKTSPETPSTSTNEKDSGVCDDKSETGTYTLAAEHCDLDVEKARQRIDEVFGVKDYVKKNAPASGSFASTPESPTSTAAARTFWMKHCSPTHSARPQQPHVAEDHDVDRESGQRSGTFTRHKRRTSLDSNGDVSSSTTLTKGRASPRESYRPQSRDSPETLSPRSVRSSRTYQAANKHGLSPLVGRKSSEPGYRGRSNDAFSAKSDDSTDQDSCFSANCRSDSQARSSLKLNRAFALRRARLGIETPGVSINSSREKHETASSPSFNRNDGGRFSLRLPRSGLSAQKPPSGSSSRPSSGKDEMKKPTKKSDPAARARLYGKTVSDVDRRNCSPPSSLNSLQHSSSVQRSSSFGSHKEPNYAAQRAEERQMRGMSPFQVTMSKRMFSTKPHQMVQLETTVRKQQANVVPMKRADNSLMTSSLIERRACVGSPDSLESPSANRSWSERSSKTRELSALDNLVVTAILQLSHKLRHGTRECLEKEKLKYAPESETRIMIDELLPQVAALDARMAGNSETGTSKDLSNILKNLKKVEQSLEVLSLLGEISAVPTHPSLITANGDKQHSRQERRAFEIDV